MAKEERDWGVAFTDDGLNELGHDLKPHLTEEGNGVYMFCKHVDMSLPLLCMVVDSPNSDGSPGELEIYVPYHYVKLIVAGLETKVIGFLRNSK